MSLKAYLRTGRPEKSSKTGGMTVKKTGKKTFFIVVAFIAIFAVTSVLGIDKLYGDNRTTYVKGVDDIRLGIDIKGGVDVTFGPAGDFDADEAQLDSATEVIKTRLSSLGITDNEVYSDTKSDRIIVRFPWKVGESNFDPESAVKELGEMAELTFRKGTDTTTDAEGNTIPSGEIVLTGDDIASAKSQYLPTDDGKDLEYVVSLELKSDGENSGKEKFAAATGELMGTETPISIWMDNTMISAPRVNSTITDGRAQISGSFDADSSKKLADQINSGALPFKMETKSFRTISPTMGEGSLDAILLAALIAFVGIAVYMIFLYRLPGFVAVIALCGQVAGSIAAITGWFGFQNGATLTITRYRRYHTCSRYGS